MYALQCKLSLQVSTRHQTTRETHIVWENSLKEPFRIALSDESERLSHITQTIDNQSINETVSQFTTIIRGHAENIFSKREIRSNGTHASNKRNDWFDDNGRIAKREFCKARKQFIRCKTNETKIPFLSKKSECNKIKRMQKKHHLRKEGNELYHLAKNQPKQFWKKIKRPYKQHKNRITDTHE